MQKAIIIDDERLARNELKKLLLDFPEIEVVGEAANAAEGLEKIENLSPDLIFLDIQMPGKTGFDMLTELDSAPHVIFTKIEFSHKGSKAGPNGAAGRAQRKMRSIFLLRAFVPLWQIFRSEAEKKAFLLSFAKSLKHFYECLRLDSFSN